MPHCFACVAACCRLPAAVCLLPACLLLLLCCCLAWVGMHAPWVYRPRQSLACLILCLCLSALLHTSPTHPTAAPAVPLLRVCCAPAVPLLCPCCACCAGHQAHHGPHGQGALRGHPLATGGPGAAGGCCAAACCRLLLLRRCLLLPLLPAWGCLSAASLCVPRPPPAGDCHSTSALVSLRCCPLRPADCQPLLWMVRPPAAGLQRQCRSVSQCGSPGPRFVAPPASHSAHVLPSRRSRQCCSTLLRLLWLLRLLRLPPLILLLLPPWLPCCLRACPALLPMPATSLHAAAVAVAGYLHYVVSMVNEICAFLNIPCLTIRKVD